MPHEPDTVDNAPTNSISTLPHSLETHSNAATCGSAKEASPASSTLTQTPVVTPQNCSTMNESKADEETCPANSTTDKPCELQSQYEGIQLQRWLYEIAKDRLTLAERLERSRWEDCGK